MTARSSLRHATVVLLAACTLVAALLMSAGPAQAAVGLRVEDGRLYEADGNEFIMRGVSHAHAWYANELDSLADIKRLGANTVRVVLSSGARWTRNDASDVANVISQCKANRLICMLEVHDTTGYGEEGAAISLGAAVDYWISIQEVLQGQEDYILINIGNEPWGNSGYEQWPSATSNAISRMRSAGFDHTLIVDAPNWGQDWSFTMRDNAAQVYTADPTGNTMFSIHMYGVFDTASEVSSYLNTFVNAGLPILVGEFGHDHSDGNPDENAIMATAQSLGVGYIGWSWSGNGGGVEYLDMVNNFDGNSLTSWGQRIFNGANGIAQTAEEASVFDGQPDPDPDPNPDPNPDPDPDPGTGGCSASYAIVNEWPGGFQGEITVTAGNSGISGWTVNWSFGNGQSITQSWNVDITSSGSSVTASNVGYNGSLSAGGSTRFGFIGSWNGSNSAPSVSCTAG